MFSSRIDFSTFTKIHSFSVKTNLARVLCFNTVLILLFGIFFTASNTFFKKENTTKEFQF